MKTYSNPSTDLTDTLERMRQAYHAEELRDVTLGALFVFDAEDALPCLKHQGYPAAAVVRISPLRDRALGLADAVVVVDRATWQTLSAAQKDALCDHELEHLERVIDAETDNLKFDALDRPKLKMRHHTHQVGFFTEVVRRHGASAIEVKTVNALLEDCKQLPFNFGTLKAAA